MTVSPAARDLRVRDHFDKNVALYVDKEILTYRTACAQRLALLREVGHCDSRLPYRLLDIGCGGGLFSDIFLGHFPLASACGVDASIGMLRQNSASPRKSLVLGDARRLPFLSGRFDVINIDALMHHLVDGRSYSHTIDGVGRFLSTLHDQLAPGGLVMVREIYHEYRLRQNLGSRLLYSVSTLRLPDFFARLLKAAGIQTANAGVCFLTRRQWARVFDDAGFDVIGFEDRVWPGQPYRKFGFARCGDLHYVLRPRESRKE